MISPYVPYCDCCGLPIHPNMGDHCPRCGYPVIISKEEGFLETSLRDLRRVATHGGSNVTVAQLIQRYQMRLNFLHQLKMKPLSAPVVQEIAPTLPPPTQLPQNIVQPPILPVVPLPTQHPQSIVQPAILPVELPPAQPIAPTPMSPNVVAHIPNGPQQPARVFSFRSFFADQTINIVASLGAFLILVGSLSFVATTSDLLSSFIIMFLVHIAFATTGMVTYRFQSFRIVSVIYTAIFALLVPLVGFSGYRLVAGHLIQLSSPTIVAIAAAYAAIVYGSLAVYQKFSPFGYLSVVALAIADLAVANAFNLGYWWWPSMLMLLALPSLVSLTSSSGDQRPFTGTRAILREPVSVLMIVSVIVCGLGAIVTFLLSWVNDLFGRPQGEIHFSIASVTLLLFCWTCLFLWRTRQARWIIALPYQCLTVILTFCYTLGFRQVGYVLALTTVAILYHVITRFSAKLLQSYHKLQYHMEKIALVLVGCVPFIATPFLPLQILERAYAFTHPQLGTQWEIVAEILSILVGLVLTVSITLKHTGMRRVPDVAHVRWCRLLLLSGFLLNWMYSIILISFQLEPVWWFLGFALIFVAGAVIVRRFISAAWANPLDVLAILGVVQTLALSLRQDQNHIISLLFFFTALSYSIFLYQRRQNLLFVPIIFAILSLPFLWLQPLVLFVVCLVLPLASAMIHRLITTRRNIVTSVANPILVKFGIAVSWEWPLVVIDLLYAFIFIWIGLMMPVSIVRSVFSITFAVTIRDWLLSMVSPVTFCIASLSLVWYVSAVLARVRWWLLVMLGFAVVGLLIPGNSFGVLAWFAPIMAILALGTSRFASKYWAGPLYIIAMFVAVVMGLAAYSQSQVPAATWTLLIFSLVIYLIGIVEREQIFVWIAPFFAIWSVYYSEMLGDIYRLFIVALICAVIGVGIGHLKFVSQVSNILEKSFRLYAMPFYTVAIAAAVLTGVYGMMNGANMPFYAAIPGAMFVYALVAYSISILEHRVKWQWFVAVFALWGAILTIQTTTCLNFSSTSIASNLACRVQVQITSLTLAGVTLGTGILGILTSYFVKREPSTGSIISDLQAKFSWSWPWYLTSLVAILLAVGWNSVTSAFLPGSITFGMLGIFMLLTLAIMLIERAPELLIIPFTVAVWTLSQIQLVLWQQMIAYSLLFVLVFASRFIWNRVPAETRVLPPKLLHEVLGLGGQVLIVLTIILRGGLLAGPTPLAHIGALALLVLVGLIFWYGSLQTSKVVQRWSIYCTGLLLSLVVSWELSALGQTHIDLLTLAPATYLIVVAPFLSRDEVLPEHHMIGQICSIAGAALLLLPTLWLSFNQDNLQATLILAGESLALLLLGVVTRVRIFILSGAGLVVVSAIHILFLPSLAIPPSLALAIVGAILLTIATCLTLARRRLLSAWSHWE